MSAEGARKLFVGGLADSISDAELRSVFEGAGFVVEHLALPRDRETGRLRGFAFVTLSSEEEASRARSQLQGVQCGGRPLSLREFSQEPPKRTGPGGSPGGERPKREPEPTVFLGKLPFEATQAQIEQLFSSEGVGPIVRLTLPSGPDGRPRGFGFATLASQEQVDAAVARVNGATLLGRQIVVSPAQPRGAGGGPGGPGGPGRGPGGPGGPGGGDSRRSGGGRFSDSGGESSPAVSFDPFDMSPPFPPSEGRGGRRRDGGKKEKREKKRGGGGGEGSSSAPRGGAGGAAGGRKKRGGGANWHRWEVDDD